MAQQTTARQKQKRKSRARPVIAQVTAGTPPNVQTAPPTTADGERTQLEDAQTLTPVPITAKTQILINQVMASFLAYSDGFTHLTEARGDLAPRFMKACVAWQSETGGQFVDFVRVVDPTVPKDRKGYRAHSSYMAADNLRRLNGPQREPLPEGARPASAYTALARLVATVLPVVDPTGVIWAAFVKQMHWSEKQAQRLRTAGESKGALRLATNAKQRLTLVKQAVGEIAA